MIVMEFMENKSLDVYLRVRHHPIGWFVVLIRFFCIIQKNDDLLGAKKLVTMAKGVAGGMQYFGEIGFVHRVGEDVKATQS